ncbi:MAG: rod shape-determining protein RodA [Acidobacteria bacterium]|nr:rod shape-determining protein RodA [Acidobacteriota bacterium]
MINRRIIGHFDFFLFGTAVVLALLGVLGIFSATIHGGPDNAFLRQIAWLGVGIATCLIMVSVDYHFLADHAYFFYGAAVLILIAILFYGTEINGSKSWLILGGLRVQPSEFVKVIVVLALANFLARLNEDYLKRHHLLILSLITLLPVVLIILQGDLGTALMYFPILLGMLAVAGLKVRLTAVVLLVTLCVAPAGWFFLKEYQRERILATINPDMDPQGIGYQTRQSQIAIGSGGFLGKGLGRASQSQLGFVPEIHTDFIFTLLAEEKGFLGASIVLVLYLLLLMRLVRIAETARDRTGIFIVSGIACLLFFHALVNVGMTVGVFPPIGIPLPLLSYGGSSTIMTFAALGLALNVHCRRFVN